MHCVALGIWGVKQLKGALMFKAPHAAVFFHGQTCARRGARQQPSYSAHVPRQYPSLPGWEGSFALPDSCL